MTVLRSRIAQAAPFAFVGVVALVLLLWALSE